MIGSVRIHGFKRFEDLSIDLRALTVLTGMNGSGKSTVTQALMLINEAGDSRKTIPLVEDSGLDLGHASDVSNHNNPFNDFSLTISGDQNYTWVFSTGEDPEVPFLSVVAAPGNAPYPFTGENKAFTYLSAERLGPRITHPAAPCRTDESVVGHDGRFAAHALAVAQREDVGQALLHPSTDGIPTLRAQTEAWMSDLVGTIQIDSSLISGTNLVHLKVKKPQFSSEWVLPTNMGFGVSYALPVVVAGLICPPESLLIVDSPEAHLHPAGQSAMGAFLATVASSGVQVVLETHSDHVINGIRRFVSESEALKPEDVRFNFFDDSGVEEISVDARGRLSSWPAGFFDQMDRDLHALTKRNRVGLSG